MFNVREYLLADSLEEAYSRLSEKKTNLILGGTTFLRMGSRNVNLAIDLSNLGLDKIELVDGQIEIGAYVSYYDIETSVLLKKFSNGVLSKCISDIIGTQFRRLVRVGSSIYSKYGFSDFIPVLLALDAKVELYKNGVLSLEEFLKADIKRDILVKVIIPYNTNISAGYNSLRLTATDFPILNACVSVSDDETKIVVGARPSIAKIAYESSALLYKMYKKDEVYNFEKIANLMDKELTYSTNVRGSKEYRSYITKVLVERLIKELGIC